MRGRGPADNFNGIYHQLSAKGFSGNTTLDMRAVRGRGGRREWGVVQDPRCAKCERGESLRAIHSAGPDRSSTGPFEGGQPHQGHPSHKPTQPPGTLCDLFHPCNTFLFATLHNLPLPCEPLDSTMKPHARTDSHGRTGKGPHLSLFAEFFFLSLPTWGKRSSTSPQPTPSLQPYHLQPSTGAHNIPSTAWTLLGL